MSLLMVALLRFLLPLPFASTHRAPACSTSAHLTFISTSTDHTTSGCMRVVRGVQQCVCPRPLGIGGSGTVRREKDAPYGQTYLEGHLVSSLDAS